jgi:hypothetical protein
MSLADLAGKPVAIDDRHGSSTHRKQNALAAAGAAELHDGRSAAIDDWLMSFSGRIDIGLARHRRCLSEHDWIQPLQGPALAVSSARDKAAST